MRFPAETQRRRERKNENDGEGVIEGIILPVPAGRPAQAVDPVSNLLLVFSALISASLRLCGEFAFRFGIGPAAYGACASADQYAGVGEQFQVGLDALGQVSVGELQGWSDLVD